jgi:CheY-like chemotaxis protein
MMERILGTRLLVVDDDPTIREMLEMLLDSEGYEVATACNGADALEATRSKPCRGSARI